MANRWGDVHACISWQGYGEKGGQCEAIYFVLYPVQQFNYLLVEIATDRLVQVVSLLFKKMTVIFILKTQSIKSQQAPDPQASTISGTSRLMIELIAEEDVFCKDNSFISPFWTVSTFTLKIALLTNLSTIFSLGNFTGRRSRIFVVHSPCFSRERARRNQTSLASYTKTLRSWSLKFGVNVVF